MWLNRALASPTETPTLSSHAHVHTQVHTRTHALTKELWESWKWSQRVLCWLKNKLRLKKKKNLS